MSVASLMEMVRSRIQPEKSDPSIGDLIDSVRRQVKRGDTLGRDGLPSDDPGDGGEAVQFLELLGEGSVGKARRFHYFTLVLCSHFTITWQFLSMSAFFLSLEKCSELFGKGPWSPSSS